MAVRSTQETELVSSRGSSKVRSTQETLLVSSRKPSSVRSTQEILLISVPLFSVGITYPLTAPAISGLGPQDFSLIEVNVIGETDSPFTLSQQLQQWPGQMWELELTMPPLLTTEAEQWIAFLGSLFGKFGTFLMGDYNRPTPQGSFAGTPMINGVNASGSNQLNVRGGTVSIANWGVAGDYIQITGASGIQRIHKLLQSAATNGSGDATLEIFPSLRETYTDGITVVTSNCAGTFRLQENSIPWKIDRNKMYTISFKAKEAISI